MKGRLMRFIRTLPIKWKLMLGASLLIFLLFTSYNFAQYLVLKQWMLEKEKSQIQVNMMQLQDYFQEKLTTANDIQVNESQLYIEKMIGRNQFVRILDKEGKPIVTVASHFGVGWIEPRTVNVPELYDTTHKQDHILIHRSPLVTDKFVGTIELGSNLETFDHFSETLLWVMVVGGVLAVFISAISGLAISRQFMRPIRALASTIRSVKEKGLSERVTDVQNGDELSSLAKLFNDLMNQLETSFLQQKQFVEDASHELRTPITIVEGHLSLLHRWGKSDPAVLDESLEASLQEVRRLKKLVQELLTLTKVEANRLSENSTPLQLAPLIQETLKRFEALNPEFQFVSNTENIHDVMLVMNPLHVEQILMIILDNAVKYSLETKRIDIHAILLKQEVQIIIEDHGIGIPEADLPFVFDRFYRVDKARNHEIAGTGLGLAIAKQLVMNVHGKLTITSIETQGTRVELTLPIYQV
ncbi:HAMP domain-containing sensor histidine kinase [Paenibacillus roseipurpureus]|uniref:Signal transduction histidine-protein kinase ArlS n=1 Tax=Paenibacillus roseopurpureus TaxID=2918901 RepID=A0AA96RLE9_9BACL|nr:HAMP domain-containing histidine kinase [Paenibacillus sp. MBLB1832]WNR43102.1 HAMP domain-containing histidine kinase [Paenibacillus sp. MBLB1832]